MFDMQQYLKDNNISFQTEGKNCSIGFLNTTCLWCSDHSNHLGLHESKGYGSCWLCGHKSLYEIISKITPFENPQKIIQQYSTNIIIENKIEEKINYNNTSIKLPGDKLSLCHKNYLKSRHFDPEYLEQKYKLKGTLHHKDYPYRIIIPIYFNDQLVTYQTRNIKGKSYYINCNPEKEIIPIKECIYNLENCNQNYIIVTEGVFKVFRLGDNSCCLFGKNFTSKQILPLLRYDKIFIYYDPDAQKEAKKLCNIFDSLGKEVFNINNNKAPDDLNEKEVKEFWRDIFNVL